MTPEQHKRVSEVFLAVCDADPGSRQALLESSCGPDSELRESVESLLAHHDHPSAMLDQDSALPELMNDLVTTFHRSAAEPPARIGRCTIIRRLGEGGMGAVFLAEQDRPRRTVAVKIMRFGFSSPDILRRFEFEQEVLARLHHPGIAQIYEAAADDHGQPFFVMEYVDGQPLTAFARAKSLATADNLALVARICDAVQHAHQRGVIHRDLKPSNILVNDAGQPKILDFGVARAIGPEAANATLQTHAGQLIGTLSYMSPEQISGDVMAIDARADVYALGVILYELLVGRLPHDITGKSLPEAARIVEGQEPPRLGAIDRNLRGDVEAIVHKALEKDVMRRYQSAAELADDLRRCIAGEPIAAKHDSALYVLRKQLKRYRRRAIAAIVFLTLVAGFAVYAAWQAHEQSLLFEREKSARGRADDATAKANEAQVSEQKQREVAQLQAQRAESVSGFLVKMLGMADSDISQEPSMSVDALLDRAAAEVSIALGDQQEAEASIRAVIGRAYASQGELEQAEFHLRRALDLQRAIGPNNHEAIYEIVWPLWRVLADLDDLSVDIPRRESLKLGRAIIEKKNPELAQAMYAFMSEMGRTFNQPKADALLIAAMNIADRTLLADDPLWIYVADQLHVAGWVMGPQYAPAAAAQYLEKALEIERLQLPETNTRIVRTLDALITAKIAAGEHREAEQLLRESLSLLERLLPQDHWYVAMHGTRLGQCLIGQGRFNEAEHLMLDNHAKLIKSRGERNSHAVEAHRSLIILYDAWGRQEKAAEHRMKLARGMASLPRPLALSQIEIMLEPQEHELYDALVNLRTAVGKRNAEISPALDEAMALRRKYFADDHPVTACVADALHVWVRRHQDRGGDPAETRRLLLECVAIDDAGHLRHPRRQAGVLWHLGTIALQLRQLDDAENYARRAIDVMQSGPPERPGVYGTYAGLLGEALAAKNQFDDAEPFLIAAYQDELRGEGPIGQNTHIATGRLIEMYVKQGRLDEADTLAVQMMKDALASGSQGVDFNRAAWRVVRSAGLSKQAYSMAREAGRRAVNQNPEHGAWLNTLGAAQYRAGDYSSALQSLEKANLRSGNKLVEDAAFLAMTHHKLGQPNEAQVALDHMEKIARESKTTIKPDRWVLVDEARKLIIR